VTGLRKGKKKKKKKIISRLGKEGPTKEWKKIEIKKLLA